MLKENRSGLKNIQAGMSADRCPDCQRVMFLREETNEPFCWHCEVIAPEDKKLAEETIHVAQELEFQKQLVKFKEYSLINAKLEKASFFNYKPQNEEQAYAKEVCAQYGEKFNPDMDNLMLWGPYGTGKSHLAKSITDVVMQKGIACLFISMPKLLTKIKSTYQSKDGMTEFDILEVVAKVPLLVLDDMGAEQTKKEQGEKEFSWQKTKLFEIIDSRAGRPTIYTMNMDPQMLKQNYGEREAGRILDDVVILYVPGDNYRVRNHEWWE